MIRLFDLQFCLLLTSIFGFKGDAMENDIMWPIPLRLVNQYEDQLNETNYVLISNDYGDVNATDDYEIDVDEKKDIRFYPQVEYSESEELQQRTTLPINEKQSEVHHRDDDEEYEERYNYGSYDFIRRKHTHDYSSTNNEKPRQSASESSEARDQMPRIVKMDESGMRQLIPWKSDGEAVEQDWWIETIDPKDDTVITYGQMRKHKMQ